MAISRFFLVTLISLFKRQLFGKNKKSPPLVLLYGHKLNSNLKALYLELEKKQNTFEFYFLTMDQKYFKELKNNNTNALNACRLSTIIPLSNASVIVSDHGLHCLQLFLGKSDVKFTDVWHGLPFKGFDGDDFKVQHQYDAVCVTSTLLKKLYVERFEFEPQKIKITGYGRADLLKSSPSKMAFTQHNIPDDGSKVILFAPTWKQNLESRSIYPFNLNENDFLLAMENICLENKAYFILRTHLNSLSPEASRFEKILVRPHSQYPDTESLLAITDLLVCDWSSISLDYMLLRRPTIFLDVPAPFDKGFSLPPTYRVGPICKSITHLERELTTLLSRPSVYLSDYGSRLDQAIEDLYGPSPIPPAAPKYIETIETLLASS